MTKDIETAESVDAAVIPDRAPLDKAIAVLQSSKDAWLETPLVDRIQLLEAVIQGFAKVSEAWVAKSCTAKMIEIESSKAGEEWLAGPYTILRHLRLLKTSLVDVERRKAPRLPGSVKQTGDGRRKVQVFPTDMYDRLFFQGTTAEIWLENTEIDQPIDAYQAHAYRKNRESGKISLVLSAGNVSSIGPLDAIYKLFYELQVVLIKTHPVNDYLQPLMEEAFRPLVSRGFVQIVKGGAEEGAYLCHHPAIADIHITGSDRTHDAIVFGEDVAARKASRQPVLTKPITSELGNVSPMIVVPGPWSESDIAFQAENVASSLANNAGFNCNATRVIITHRGWKQREAFMDALRDQLRRLKPRSGYYPGASERHQRFLQAHPEAEVFGSPEEGELPWTLISPVPAGADDDICFNIEAFCSVFAETGLDSATVPEFIERAVAFANDCVWGTLNVSMLVHPKSMADANIREAMNDAVESLKFGTVAINHWAAIGFAMGSTSWGAYPGHDIYDIRSGVGVVHNTYMLENIEKTVIRGPFRPWPKPAWFASHASAHVLGRRLATFEANHSFAKVPGIFLAALRG